MSPELPRLVPPATAPARTAAPDHGPRPEIVRDVA